MLFKRVVRNTKFCSHSLLRQNGAKFRSLLNRVKLVSLIFKTGYEFLECIDFLRSYGPLVLPVFLEYSVQVRRVAVGLWFKSAATGFSIHLFLLAVPLAATVVIGMESLSAAVPEMRSITGAYGEVQRLLLYPYFLSIMGYFLISVG